MEQTARGTKQPRKIPGQMTQSLPKHRVGNPSEVQIQDTRISCLTAYIEDIWTDTSGWKHPGNSDMRDVQNVFGIIFVRNIDCHVTTSTKT